MASSSESFAAKMCARGVASVCHDVGFGAAQEPAIKVLSEVCKVFVLRLASHSRLVAESDNRVRADVLDVMHVLGAHNESCESLGEFLSVVRARQEAEGEKGESLRDLHFPLRAVDRLNFPKAGSAELLSREAHVDAHLPPMFPELEDEREAEVRVKRESQFQGLEIEEGEQRSAGAGERVALSQAKEHNNAGERGMYESGPKHEVDGVDGDPSSLREMSSVKMTSAGFISPARIGKLPGSRSDNDSANDNSAFDSFDISGSSLESTVKSKGVQEAATKKSGVGTNASNAKKLSIFQKKKSVKEKSESKKNSSVNIIAASKAKAAAKLNHTTSSPSATKKGISATKRVLTPSPGLKKELSKTTTISITKKGSSVEPSRVISKLPPINQALKQVAPSSTPFTSTPSTSSSAENPSSVMTKGRQSLLDQTRAVISKAVEKQKEAKKQVVDTELKASKLFKPTDENASRKSGSSTAIPVSSVKSEPTPPSSLLAKLSPSVTIFPSKKRHREPEPKPIDKLPVAESSGFNIGYPENSKKAKLKSQTKKTSKKDDVVILKEAEPEVPLPLMMMNNPLIPKQFYYGLDLENAAEEEEKARESKKKKHMKKEKERKKKERFEKRNAELEVEIEKTPLIPKLKIKEMTQPSNASSSVSSSLQVEQVEETTSAITSYSSPSLAVSSSNKGLSSKRTGMPLKTTITSSGSSTNTSTRKRRSVETKVMLDDEHEDDEHVGNVSNVSVSGNSGSGGGTIITQTVGYYIDADGNQIWICPACGKQDDGSAMIGCDSCDDWYHWLCVGISQEPEESQNWYCQRCVAKKQLAAAKKRTKNVKMK